MLTVDIAQQQQKKIAHKHSTEKETDNRWQSKAITLYF